MLFEDFRYSPSDQSWPETNQLVPILYFRGEFLSQLASIDAGRLNWKKIDVADERQRPPFLLVAATCSRYLEIQKAVVQRDGDYYGIAPEWEIPDKSRNVFAYRHFLDRSRQTHCSG